MAKEPDSVAPSQGLCALARLLPRLSHSYAALIDVQCNPLSFI